MQPFEKFRGETFRNVKLRDTQLHRYLLYIHYDFLVPFREH